MNLPNSLVVTTIAALTLSSSAFAADSEKPAITATCRKAGYGGVVDGKPVAYFVAQVDLLIRGDHEKDAYAIGEVTAKPIEFDGREIPCDKPRFWMGGFSWLDRWFPETKQPADGVLVQLSFSDIPKEAKQIDKLEGTVQMLTGGDEKQVAIKDLTRRKPGPIESPVLDAAGLRVSFKREEELPLEDDVEVGIKMNMDERSAFAGLRMVEPSGRLSDRTPVYSIHDDETFECGYRIAKADLAKAGLLILVRVGGKLKTIPFKAENIAIK